MAAHEPGRYPGGRSSAVEIQPYSGQLARPGGMGGLSTVPASIGRESRQGARREQSRTSSAAGATTPSDPLAIGAGLDPLVPGGLTAGRVEAIIVDDSHLALLRNLAADAGPSRLVGSRAHPAGGDLDGLESGATSRPSPATHALFVTDPESSSPRVGPGATVVQITSETLGGCGVGQMAACLPGIVAGCSGELNGRAMPMGAVNPSDGGHAGVTSATLGVSRPVHENPAQVKASGSLGSYLKGQVPVGSFSRTAEGLSSPGTVGTLPPGPASPTTAGKSDRSPSVGEGGVPASDSVPIGRPAGSRGTGSRPPGDSIDPAVATRGRDATGTPISVAPVDADVVALALKEAPDVADESQPRPVHLSGFASPLGVVVGALVLTWWLKRARGVAGLRGPVAVLGRALARS